MAARTVHVPVLLDEIIGLFANSGCRRILDATFGGGGHSVALLRRIPAAKVWALDRDRSAYERGRSIAETFPGRLLLHHAPFSTIGSAIDAGMRFDGILFDLGVSSDQLSESGRGFSFRLDGPLDMRMDLSTETTAADLVNWSLERELSRIFLEFGEESRAAPIARCICQARKIGPLTTTKQLADLIASQFPVQNMGKGKGMYRHPATQVFQALRIAVNQELRQLGEGLSAAYDRLAPEGLLAVISFHALEDRIAKHFIHSKARDSTELQLSRQPTYPQSSELLRNPRARSAKMRILRKIQL